MAINVKVIKEGLLRLAPLILLVYMYFWISYTILLLEDFFFQSSVHNNLLLDFKGPLDLRIRFCIFMWNNKWCNFEPTSWNKFSFLFICFIGCCICKKRYSPKHTIYWLVYFHYSNTRWKYAYVFFNPKFYRNENRICICFLWLHVYIYTVPFFLGYFWIV